jgi:hypothetical protein
VRISRSFPVVALLASFRIVQLVRLGLFLLKFLDVAVDTHGLEVAPQTHEHIKKGQDAHQTGFVVIEKRV